MISDLLARVGCEPLASFDHALFATFVERVRRGAFSNRVVDAVEAPAAADIARMPPYDSADYRACYAIGAEALARGEVAFVVLAGGMATRMGGVVKALVPVFDDVSFLEFRLRSARRVERKWGRLPPLWLMSSFATQGPIRQAIAHDQTRQPVAEFCQNSSLRLTPAGDLFLLDGVPSPYSTGHGDLPECLQKSGLLRDFIAGGGKTVWIANIDNIGAGIEPAILGFHLRCGAPMSVELVAKREDDRGGIPVRRAGRLEILEEFRLPLGFDARSVPVFNTNTFLVNATALQTTHLEWTYFQVQKNVNGHEIVQFERLLGELTSALPCNYMQVARTGIQGRFLPVKDEQELRLRRDEILEIARDREIFAQV